MKFLPASSNHTKKGRKSKASVLGIHYHHQYASKVPFPNASCNARDVARIEGLPCCVQQAPLLGANTYTNTSNPHHGISKKEKKAVDMPRVFATPHHSRTMSLHLTSPHTIHYTYPSLFSFFCSAHTKQGQKTNTPLTRAGKNSEEHAL